MFWDQNNILASSCQLALEKKGEGKEREGHK